MAFGDLFDRGKKEEKALKKERKKKNKIWQEKLSRELSYADCAATLERCKLELDTIIKLERMRYNERVDKGLDPKNQKERIANAAKGRRIVDQALAELEDNRNTEDLNTSINLVCLAVRQLDRVSDSTPAVSKRFYGYAKGLFRSEDDYLAELNKLEMPPEVDNLVSGSFVDDLVGGDSYDACLRKQFRGNKEARSQTAAQYGAMLDEIPSGGTEYGASAQGDIRAARKMTDL